MSNIQTEKEREKNEEETNTQTKKLKVLLIRWLSCRMFGFSKKGCALFILHQIALAIKEERERERLLSHNCI